jgi:hypothetical protein
MHRHFTLRARCLAPSTYILAATNLALATYIASDTSVGPVSASGLASDLKLLTSPERLDFMSQFVPCCPTTGLDA